MKRLIDYHLKKWIADPSRKPILLHGARQVGKTHAVESLSTSFTSFVEINFELQPQAAKIFEQDLDPNRLIRDLSLHADQKIIPGKTLLFLDEIQGVPKAIVALRYFYEKIPSLHVIAAGSLIDFAIESIGIPVGRVTSLYMYPMSFIEFLYALDKKLLIEEILNHSIDQPMNEMLHDRLLGYLGEYLAIGGMPEVVKAWRDSQDPFRCQEVHQDLINAYRQDFKKYAKKHQIKYVELLFNRIPRLLGKQIVFKQISDTYRKRELSPALELLITADIVHPVIHSSGNATPLGGEAKPERFKLIFLDIALAQAILGLDLKAWFLNPKEHLVNKGAITESFVGQEFLAYSNPRAESDLYYWHRQARGSQSEVDYLLQKQQTIYPVEVKSGPGGTLRSLRTFMESRKNVKEGLRLSIHNYSIYDHIISYPLYAIAKIFSEDNPALSEFL